MNEIGKEYGTALFMLACENGKTDRFIDDLKLIEDAFTDNPEYLNFLNSPVISVNERLTAIEQVFSDNIDEYVLSFLKLMCEKGRIMHLSESVNEYYTLYNESKKVLKAVITSAVELSESEKSNLESKLEAKYSCSITADYFVDADLLGGIIVEIDGKVIDGSIRTRLRNIKEVIKE